MFVWCLSYVLCFISFMLCIFVFLAYVLFCIVYLCFDTRYSDMKYKLKKLWKLATEITNSRDIFRTLSNIHDRALCDYTAWKVSKYGVFLVPIFLYRIEYRKRRTGKNSVFGNFSRSASYAFKSNFFGKKQLVNKQKQVNKNKKSHWLRVSARKLLGDQSGNIKMPNGFFG